MRSEAWVLTAAGRPLEKQAITVPEPRDGEAIVEVEACGLCHTDLGFADGSVTPRMALPIVLGHEIVGTVTEAAGPATKLIGRHVIVPAVLPCGDCAFCRAGRGNACPAQKMPGNDIDGGFARHVLVPAHVLVPVDDAPPHIDRRELSIVADAVSTAYQAIHRSDLQPGDGAFVIGAGGVGAFAIQLARAFGARVIACDVSKERLELVRRYGADRVVEVAHTTPKEVRREVHAIAKGWGIPSIRFRIFECSGTPPGQLLAYALLANAATMVQVGYTAANVELRLSNVMAFDATVHGSWGCPPATYPVVLGAIYARDVVLGPFVEHAPMSRINEFLDAMANHHLSRRLVLDPRA
jgi:6-hydroxycyclohex-1-ene-1-carbonyl-CoA dehydrogenase